MRHWLRTELPVCLLPFFILLIAGPAQIYFSNSREFAFGFLDLLPIALVISFAGAIFLSLGLNRFIRCMPRSRPIAISAMLSFGVLLWVQGSILVRSYGPMDGSQIPWGDFSIQGAVDVAVWVLLSLVIVRFRDWVAPRAPAISVALIVVQLISALIAAQASNEGFLVRRYAIDSAPRVSFSQARNVIVLVLDEFQSDVFQEIVDLDPAVRSGFRDFVYFRNATAAAQQTFPGIPALLTGEIYDNSVPAQDFLKTAYSNHSIPKVLSGKGYAVEAYPWVNDVIPYDPTLLSNLKPREFRLESTLLLFDASLFRHFPQGLKKRIFADGAWFLSRSTEKQVRKGRKLDARRLGDMLAFRSELSSDLSANREEPVFKFIHLFGAHVPLRLRADLSESQGPLDYSRENYRGQARAALKVTSELLDELRRAGVYRDSVIAIVGDHGSGRSRDMWLTGSELEDEEFQKHKARGVPLVLFKRAGASNPFVVSENAVSLIDLPATVFSELGIETRGAGVSFFSKQPIQGRKRYYYSYAWKTFDPRYLSPLTEYEISGHSWHDGSWRKTGRVFAPASGRAL